MGRVEASITIRAPIDDVFRYIADGENSPEWHPTIIEAKRIMGTELGVGSTVLYKARIGFLELAWVTRAVEFEWNKRFHDVLVKVVRGPLKSYELIGEFEEIGRGTLVRLELYYELGWGRLGEVIDGLIMERRVARHMEEGLLNAKAIIESKL